MLFHLPNTTYQLFWKLLSATLSTHLPEPLKILSNFNSFHLTILTSYFFDSTSRNECKLLPSPH